MFALSHDGQQIFLHQPDAGLVVPVLLDLANRHLTVRVPSVDELENDYAVYDELNELLLDVGSSYHEQVDFARRVSRECSTTYRDEISTGKLTISELRWLFEDSVRRAAAYRPRVTSSEVSDPAEAAFARSFSVG